MATLSRSRISPVMVKQETTYGTDAAPTDGTDDLLLFNTPNPHRAEFSRFEIRPHNSTLTNPLDIIGQRVMLRNLQTIMMGSGTAGNDAVNGYTALQALLLSGGLAMTDTTGPDVLTFTPATIAQLNTYSGTSPKCGSATIWSELGGSLTAGYAHKTAGCMGNLRLTGNPTQAMMLDYSGLGIYAGPTQRVTAEWNAHGTSLTNRGVPFLNVGGSLKIGAGTAYTGMVFDSFSFDAGCDIQRVSDANSTTGLHSLLFVDRRPTCSVVIALDLDTTAASSTFTYDDIYTSVTASTTHTVEFALPGGTGNNVQFNFPTAQLIDIVPGEARGYRLMTLNYKLTGTVDNEYNWAID